MTDSDDGGMTTPTFRNTIRLAAWTAAWVGSMAIANPVSMALGPSNKTLILVLILGNVAIGTAMILANKRHLDGLDELQRKIQLDAMAITLGVGLVAGFGYSNLDHTNVIASDAEISVLLVIMAVTYISAALLGTRRYC